MIPGVTGGGETYLAGLVRGLAAVDSANRYTLFVGPENRKLFDTGRSNFECVTVPFSQHRRVRRVLYEHMQLPREARRRGIEVLYCPGNAASTRAPLR